MTLSLNNCTSKIGLVLDFIAGLSRQFLQFGESAGCHRNLYGLSAKEFLVSCS